MARAERIDSGAGVLTIVRATPNDVDAMVELNATAADWVRARGFDPGEPPLPLQVIMRRRVERSEAYVAWLDGAPVGMLSLQWEDPATWGELDTGDALYVHGLMVSRKHAGMGIGVTLLDWAGGVAAEAGRTYLRLDCTAGNPALRAYYERAGFAYRGEAHLHHYVGSRYERRALNETSDGREGA